MELTTEDFQQLLFELYLTQRENNQLRAELARLRSATAGTPGVAHLRSHDDHTHDDHRHDGHTHDHGLRSGAGDAGRSTAGATVAGAVQPAARDEAAVADA